MTSTPGTPPSSLPLGLPTGSVAEAVLRVARDSQSTSILNHSVRSFLFAQLVAEREGALNDAAYDRDLLFAATVMHDLGAGDLAHGAARFEVEGADLAAAVLTEQGVGAADVDRVWEAIALHTSPGIAERRGLLAYLTREGVGIDFGRRAELVADRAKEIHDAYPRLAMVRTLTDAIVTRAARSAAAAPAFSFAAELLRQRRENGITDLERGAAGCAWGE
ncbi:HD domain-containing protein [Streptomyces sp. NPDC052225]|uniref:HD domain-containing protein n=1 Tax=Streptomyces sp. NPDC052225 TaxID=3154949 RepID=UPI00342A7F23